MLSMLEGCKTDAPVVHSSSIIQVADIFERNVSYSKALPVDFFIWVGGWKAGKWFSSLRQGFQSYTDSSAMLIRLKD